jgi:heme exporter protein CcmD
MSDALAMGGYGPFVWSSFGLTLAGMVTCIWQARAAQAKTQRVLRSRLEAMESNK